MAQYGQHNTMSYLNNDKLRIYINYYYAVFQPSTDKRKKDLFNSERKEMVKAGEAMFKQNLKRGSVFLRNASRNDDSYYVRPMFELVWPPFIGWCMYVWCFLAHVFVHFKFSNYWLSLSMSLRRGGQPNIGNLRRSLYDILVLEW